MIKSGLENNSNRNETEKLLESFGNRRFPINDNGTRHYYFIKKDGKWYLGLDSAYDFRAKPFAGEVTINDDGSITIHGYATYAETIADRNSEYARKNVVLRELSVNIPYDELKERSYTFYNKLEDYSRGYVRSALRRNNMKKTIKSAYYTDSDIDEFENSSPDLNIGFLEPLLYNYEGNELFNWKGWNDYVRYLAQDKVNWYNAEELYIVNGEDDFRKLAHSKSFDHDFGHVFWFYDNGLSDVAEELGTKVPSNTQPFPIKNGFAFNLIPVEESDFDTENPYWVDDLQAELPGCFMAAINPSLGNRFDVVVLPETYNTATAEITSDGMDAFESLRIKSNRMNNMKNKTIKSGYDDLNLNADELYLFAVNDGDLYRRMTTQVIKNLNNKIKRGDYDEKLALKAWMYVADEAARRYDREMGSGRGSLTLFPKNVREEAAKKIQDRYAEKLDNWNPGKVQSARKKPVKSSVYYISYYGGGTDNGYVGYDGEPCVSIDMAMTFDSEEEAEEKKRELQDIWKSELRVESVDSDEQISSSRKPIKSSHKGDTFVESYKGFDIFVNITEEGNFPCVYVYDSSNGDEIKVIKSINRNEAYWRLTEKAKDFIDGYITSSRKVIKSGRYIKSGAGAAYDVTIKGLELDVANTEILENTTDSIHVKVPVKPCIVDWKAADYYNSVSSDGLYVDGIMVLEYTDEDKRVDGGYVELTIDVWEDDVNEPFDEEIIRKAIPDYIDFTGTYGWGWIHSNLPDEGLSFEYKDIKEPDIGAYGDIHIDKVELQCPNISENINWFFAHDHELEDIFFGDESEDEE